MSSRRKAEAVRARVAQEAARIMTEHGVRDFRVAKEKAAAHIGVGDRGQLPRNTEIETALRDHQNLFSGSARVERLRELREAAIEAMSALSEYQPRLVGSVLSGRADLHSPVVLHVFRDTQEEVELFLADRGIETELQDKRLRLQPEAYRYYPVYCFEVGGVAFEAVVFPLQELRQAPLSPVDGAPMQRADIKEVRRLLRGDAVPADGNPV